MRQRRHFNQTAESGQMRERGWKETLMREYIQPDPQRGEAEVGRMWPGITTAFWAEWISQQRVSLPDELKLITQQNIEFFFSLCSSLDILINNLKALQNLESSFSLSGTQTPLGACFLCSDGFIYCLYNQTTHQTSCCSFSTSTDSHQLYIFIFMSLHTKHELKQK